MDKLDDNVLRVHYRELNDSFGNNLAYGIGMHGGFFSEVNLTVVAMVYCLHHRIRFLPHSNAATFRRQLGWGDYFEHFFPEIKDKSLVDFDTRIRRNYIFNLTKPRRLYRSVKYEFDLKKTKKRLGLKYLTYDLWDEIYNRKLENIDYDIPSLGLSGDFREACHTVARLVWNLNETTQRELNRRRHELELPDKYVGFQIRRGDKHIEADLLGTKAYIEAAETRTNIRNAFVLTDDYTVMEELSTTYSEWTFWTLCQSHERGYVHTDFISKTKEQVYEGILQLIICVEILRGSELFVGTFSANPSWFLGMIMEREKTVSVDVPFQVWGGKEDEPKL